MLATFHSFSWSATKETLSRHEKAVLYPLKSVVPPKVFRKDMFEKIAVPAQSNYQNGRYNPGVERLSQPASDTPSLLFQCGQHTQSSKKETVACQVWGLDTILEDCRKKLTTSLQCSTWLLERGH